MSPQCGDTVPAALSAASPLAASTPEVISFDNGDRCTGTVERVDRGVLILARLLADDDTYETHAGPNLLVSDVTRKHFERLVVSAVRGIPKYFRDAMDNVAVVVEDHPSPELLEEMGIVPPDTLYGLYQGTPLPDREWAHGNVLPDRIAIFQRPIVEDSNDDDDIIRTIGETVIHEFGHYFGLSEAEIEEIESECWRDETEADDK